MFECQQVLGQPYRRRRPARYGAGPPHFRLRARSYQRLIIRLKIKKPVLNPYSSSMTPREKFCRRKTKSSAIKPTTPSALPNAMVVLRCHSPRRREGLIQPAAPIEQHHHHGVARPPQGNHRAAGNIQCRARRRPPQKKAPVKAQEIGQQVCGNQQHNINHTADQAPDTLIFTEQSCCPLPVRHISIILVYHKIHPVSIQRRFLRGAVSRFYNFHSAPDLAVFSALFEKVLPILIRRIHFNCVYLRVHGAAAGLLPSAEFAPHRWKW